MITNFEGDLISITGLMCDLGGNSKPVHIWVQRDSNQSKCECKLEGEPNLIPSDIIHL